MNSKKKISHRRWKRTRAITSSTMIKFIKKQLFCYKSSISFVKSKKCSLMLSMRDFFVLISIVKFNDKNLIKIKQQLYESRIYSFIKFCFNRIFERFCFFLLIRQYILCVFWLKLTIVLIIAQNNDKLLFMKTKFFCNR